LSKATYTLLNVCQNRNYYGKHAKSRSAGELHVATTILNIAT
jgi:hypothetical protein